MIGVTVKLPVHIRKGPGTSYDIMGTATPSGKVILMEGVEDGENYKGISKWYYKFNDRKEKQWYWGGRIALMNAAMATDPVAPPVVTLKSDFRSYINYLDKPWISSEGKGVLIAVIDTGISVINNDFNNALITEKDFTQNNSPNKTHGTFIAGILAAIGGEIRGIAPQAALMSLRMSDTVTGKQDMLKNCNAAFREVIAHKNQHPGLPIVINLSQGFNASFLQAYPNEINTMTGLIQQLHALQVPIFCAAGEDELLMQENLTFPASMSETIAVGCITQQSKVTVFAKSINVITPLQQYLSFNTNHVPSYNSGSSFSVAIMTALAATYYSKQGTFSTTSFFTAITANQTKKENFDYNARKFQFSF
ncbi:S8/S53 family peptidase [Chitinophaga sp.]|uniref:S8/S53 family peptidase n=1 Tax=Chitinophaga sp. TaxID=1869181 RepID=UPI0031E340A5